MRITIGLQFHRALAPLFDRTGSANPFSFAAKVDLDRSLKDQPRFAVFLSFR
jgi:hypothetical protein